jgi:hypothetical protein
MISGKGSVICCGFELVAHCGVDPAAARLLANLVRYAASKEVHHAHPLIDGSIEWGNYASERGLVTGPLNGLVVNADWVAPPTNPNAKPISQSEGAWNTRPGDQFLPHGRSPLGPFGYSTSTGLKDLNPDSKLGSGIFWARLPAGKSKVITSVTNPSREAGELTVAVNDSYSSGPVAIPAGKTVSIAAPIPNGATDISVQFTGTKSLVLLLTQFEDR